MKKSWMILLSCMLAASMMAGTALAKTDNPKAGGQNKAGSSAPSTNSKSGNAAGKTEDSKKNDSKDKKKTVTEATYTDTVTSSTYKGHNGYKGLLKAIDNVEGKPAGAVLADLLLTNYSAQLTPEMIAKLQAIQEKDAALRAAAEMLEQNGSVTDAVYVEQEAILADIKNIDSYKKLGQLYKKLGREGVMLYVNGEEAEAGTAPVIKNGTTLVPFRVIAEELGAEVVWNKKEQSVTITQDGITVKLVIGSKTAYVDGKAVTLKQAPSVVNGTTLVPVRFVSEALKATVKWENETQSVIVYEE